MPDYVIPSQNILGIGNVADHELALSGSLDALGLTTPGAVLEAFNAPAGMPAIERASDFPWWVVVVAIGLVIILSD
jgi:hypothetical protein